MKNLIKAIVIVALALAWIIGCATGMVVWINPSPASEGGVAFLGVVIGVVSIAGSAFLKVVLDDEDERKKKREAERIREKDRYSGSRY